MSIVSTIFSSRSSSRINARLAFLMDNLFAIAFGLGLRFIVDTVSHHDFKLTGTLIGLWEGVVTLHFLKKMPKSFDPYIAYAVRLFVDFLVTENLTRLVLVVVWTGLGMVLADIAPAIWHDVGGHRIWRRFRRDMYYMSRSMPQLPPLFPRARVVRFSPVIEPSEISETMSTLSPTAATPTTASQVPTTRVVPPTPAATRIPKRPVPGRFPASVISETDTELASVLSPRPGASSHAVGTSHIQYTVRPRRSSIDSGTQSPSPSVDDSNVSSDASSVSTETANQPVEIEEEIEVQTHSRDKGKGKERAVEDDDSNSPTRPPFELPPTPSDSYRPHPNRNSFVPTIAGMPSIPDFFESGLGSDWENIRREEIEQPPTPPEKDSSSPSIHYIPPPVAPSVYEPTPRPSTFDQDLWDDVSNAAPPTPYTRTTPKQRTSRLPPMTSTTPSAIPVVTKPVKKKRKSEPAPPPPVPQTPLYGDAWDTEKDQLPPPTPSVFARTPMHDPSLDLNHETDIPPADPITTAVEPGHQGPSPAPDNSQQGPADISAGFDDPWINPTPPPEQQDEQNREIQPERNQPTAVPSTPQFTNKTQSTPQISSKSPPTPQVFAKVPPTPEQKPITVPPTPQQKPTTVPPTPQQKPTTVPPTPQQKPTTVPPTPQQKPATVPPTPQQKSTPIPPTPREKPTPIPSTPQQKSTTVPPTPQQHTTSIPPTPQQRNRATLPTPRHSAQTLPPTPQQRDQMVLPTSQRRSQTVPSTPQHTSKPIPPVPRKQGQELFEDFVQEVNNLGGKPSAGLEDAPSQQTQQLPEGDLVDLGGEENGENESPEAVGDANEGNNGEDDPDGEPVQLDANNNPLSPASSGYSSVAGVPSEIKERNKQAIIIRAQIAELMKRIFELKEEKLMAQGKEELDPLSEESVLKEQEIQKAERSLEKLRKRAEKRYQAAVDSTQQLIVPKILSLNFENATVADAMTRLEDVIGLFFNAERKNIGVTIALPKGGPGKAMKAGATKVFDEYGLKSIAKMNGMSVNMSGKSYIDMVTNFRQKHAKADDDS